MGLVLQGRGLRVAEPLMLCLGLADKRTASQVSRPPGLLPFLLQPPPRQRGAGPRGEMTEPGLEEPWCFIFQIINNDDSSLPLLPLALPSL